MMFCKNCGKEIRDGAIFCPACGKRTADVGSSPVQPTGNVTGNPPTPHVSPTLVEPVAPSKKKSNRKKIIGIGVAAVAAILAIVLAAVLIFGSSPKSVAKKFTDALAEFDGKAMVKLVPDEVAKYFAKEVNKDPDEMADMLCENLKTGFEYTYGKDAKLTCKINSVQDAGKDALDEIRDEYKQYFDLDVSAVKVAEVEMAASTDKSKAETFELYLIKIGSRWYVEAASLLELM